MLRDEDVEAAVDAGIITAEQAQALHRIAGERRKARSYALGREERFRLLGGFNDFFIALGVVLLGIGLFYGLTLGSPSRLSSSSNSPGFVMLNNASWLTFGMLVMWGLAELLTGRLRLVAPSIVIVTFLTLFASAAAFTWLSAYLISSDPTHWSARSLQGGPTIFGSIAALLIVCAHYARFRLPFSLFAIALCAVLAAHALYFPIAKHALGLTPPEAARYFKWMTFGLGLAIFAWAMWFDTSDPERTSRRADCGFWLHLLAAPLIVHPLAGPLINHPLFPDYSAGRPVLTDTTVALVFLLVALLSTVALIIDRRALLVAGLGYLGAAMIYAVSQLSGTEKPAILGTLVGLGMLIIGLGVAWRQIRATLMRILPEFPLKNSLPPYGVTP